MFDLSVSFGRRYHERLPFGGNNITKNPMKGKGFLKHNVFIISKGALLKQGSIPQAPGKLLLLGPLQLK